MKYCISVCVAILMTVVSSAEAKKSYFLSDYDVTLDLLMDGSYEVKEVIAFDFSGGE
jgi:hypothetical protein